MTFIGLLVYKVSSTKCLVRASSSRSCRAVWGSLELDIDCDGGTAHYDSSEQGLGSGELKVIRLSELDGLPCSL